MCCARGTGRSWRSGARAAVGGVARPAASDRVGGADRARADGHGRRAHERAVRHRHRRDRVPRHCSSRGFAGRGPRLDGAGRRPRRALHDAGVQRGAGDRRRSGHRCRRTAQPRRRPRSRAGHPGGDRGRVLPQRDPRRCRGRSRSGGRRGEGARHPMTM